MKLFSKNRKRFYGALAIAASVPVVFGGGFLVGRGSDSEKFEYAQVRFCGYGASGYPLPYWQCSGYVRRSYPTIAPSETLDKFDHWLRDRGIGEQDYSRPSRRVCL